VETLAEAECVHEPRRRSQERRAGGSHVDDRGPTSCRTEDASNIPTTALAGIAIGHAQGLVCLLQLSHLQPARHVGSQSPS